MVRELRVGSELVKGDPLGSADRRRVTVIAASQGWLRFDWMELRGYSDLLYVLTWRDIKVRYKQTVFGAGWALLQPTLTMLVFTLFFGRLAKMPSEGVPYPVFAFAGLLPWGLFAFALTQASNSLVSNQAMITKVYFPRILLPVSSVLVGVIDFAVAFIAVLPLMAYYGVLPGLAVILLPLMVLLALGAAVGVGLWLSALNVQYRDVRHALPFLAQFWLFATPIAYPASLVPPQWQPLLGLNPMAGVVEGFRWALLGTPAPSAGLLGVAALVSAIFLVTGLAYFRRVERTFADVV